MSKITNPISFILYKCSQIHGYFVFWQYPRDVSIAIFYSQYIFVKSSFMVYVVLSIKLGKRPFSAAYWKSIQAWLPWQRVMRNRHTCKKLPANQVWSTALHKA